MPENKHLSYRRQFLNGLLDGNHSDCLRIANEFIDNETDDLKVLYEDVIRDALYEVGTLWETNQISIASEHLASAVAGTVLNDLYLFLKNSKAHGKTVIVTSVEGEFHHLGQRMISDIFEINGWHVNLLGANTTSDDLLFFIRISAPDFVAISVTLYFNIPKLEEMLRAVNKEFPDQKIIIGGQAFPHGKSGIAEKYENVLFAKNLTELDDIIR